MEFVFQFGICLAVISLVGTLSIKGKRKLIAISLLAVGLLLGISTYSYNGSVVPIPSSGQQQITTPVPTETPISTRVVKPQDNTQVIVLKQSGNIIIPEGKEVNICFSWLGDQNGRWNQSLDVGKESFSTQGSNCFPLTSRGKTFITFNNPLQTEIDTYEYAKTYKGGQGVYPFIEVKN